MDRLRFSDFAAQTPQATAIVTSRGVRWSRAELDALANRLSRGLLAHGLKTGDTVAICAPNCAELLAAYLAATQIGLYVVVMNWHLAPAEIDYVLRNSGALVLFAHERVGGVIGAMDVWQQSTKPACVSFGSLPGAVPVEDFIAPHPAGPIENPCRGRLLMYTSATTGRPKAITLPITDADVTLDRTLGFHLSNGLQPGREVHLCASMLYHIGPLDFAVNALHMGHQVILVDRWEPEALLQLIERYRVTTTFMVPTMFVRLLKLPDERRKQYDVTSLKLVVHSGAPCPVETKRAMLEWWGPIMRDGYGATEGVGTAVSSDEWLKYPGTVGRPIPGSKVRILDEAGNDVPTGVVGEIYLTRYQGDRFAYRDDPEKTRAAYRGEFFTVGDMGYLNEDGYLFVCDRKIDMIICGGTNIYPAEIEQVLLQHPKVLDCGVIGVPDKVMGEAVKAIVQLQPGAMGDGALTRELIGFMRKHTSGMKIPRFFEYVDALPRDPNGKLYKRALRSA